MWAVEIRPHLIAPPTPESHFEILLPQAANERETAVKQALRQLLSDLLSAILFLVVYAVSGSLFVAASTAVIAGLLQLAFLRLMRRRIEPMQWMSLGLVVVLGGATMLTQSPRFMMIKPTIVHFAVAAVMLRPGWMIRYLPEMVVRNVPEPAIVATGYGWAALLVALGLANLAIALRFDITTWAWFVSVGSVGTKLAAFTLQYGVFRTIVRQRLAQSTM
jgi:intracellular septation protein A